MHGFRCDYKEYPKSKTRYGERSTITRLIFFDLSFFQYLQNLVQKFNAKLGGVNGRVSLTRALTSSSTRDDVFMFFGADVTHTTCSKERPSIAAVVGSVDSTSSLTFSFENEIEENKRIFQVHSMHHE